MNTLTVAPIRKIARIHDKAKDTYLDVVEFPISDAKTGRLELPPSIVADRLAFEKRLRDAGAILPKEREALRQLLDDVAASDAPEQWVYEARTGWTQDGDFVGADWVVGSSETKIIGVNRSRDSGNYSGRLASAGKRSAWRDTVASSARHSTSMMLAISAAFAAPLLAITGRQSFTINLCGRSRAGKSVATLASASVNGTARIGDMITWNLTDAALEELLAQFNDAVFPIDDLGTMKGKGKDKYARIRDLAYNIAHGSPTVRHSSFTASQGGEQQGWRLIALTSNEKSVRDLALAARQERQHGEALRLIDVPAVYDNLDHVFDQAPPDLGESSLQDWKKETFKKIVEGSELNHGKVFRKYIKALPADRDKLKTYVEKRISFFVNEVSDEFDGDLARDVADKFGLIYAGGMLGIKHNLLPWEKQELLAAVRKSYIAARALLPDDGVLLRVGIDLLRSKLRQLPRMSKKAEGEGDFDRVDGYRKQRKKTNRHVIKTDAFNSIFTSWTQRDLVVAWLIQKQRITLAMQKASAAGLSQQPQEQFIFPDGKRRRSFEIRWPRNEEAVEATSKQSGTE